MSRCLLKLDFTLMSIVVNELGQVLICQHRRHRCWNRPEQIGSNARVECAPAFFAKNGLTRANRSMISRTIGHSVRGGNTGGSAAVMRMLETSAERYLIG